MSKYYPVEVRKRDGSMRPVMAPCAELAERQRELLRGVLSKASVSDQCHGFVRGRSIVTNATPHCGKEVVINLDIAGFFHAITLHRVAGLYASLGLSKRESYTAAHISTIAAPNGAPRHLPQGACTSPVLANLAARHLDKRLNGAARSLGYAYTRYADDMTFSGPLPYQPMLALASHIVRSEGFAINGKKTRVMVKPSLQLVTGLDVSGITPAIPQRTLLRYARTEHKCSAQRLSGIRGHILMVKQ